MDRNGILAEIAKQLQKKYSAMNRIETLTSDMQEALSRDDRVSLEMLITMRQEEMDVADECQQDIYTLVSAMGNAGNEVAGWLKSGEVPEDEDLLVKKIGELVRGTKAVVEKTIAIDQRMSVRVAGEDSYYKR